MHLLIPHASALSPACAPALAALSLPHLDALLTHLAPTERDTGDEYTLSPPHERALARALALPHADGLVPWAALQADRDGIAVGDGAWAQLSPVHWRVGRDHITLADPRALELDETDSRAAFEAVRDLFESIGYRMAWGAPLRWYAGHDSFATLPSASIDRVIGRNVDLWLQARPEARPIRRLQNEVQMLLYTHPLNDAREARGQLTLNSFWLSGCGRLSVPQGDAPTVDGTLRAAALADDWADWAAAWQALDAGPVAELLASARRGTAVALTLCGERSAQRYESAPRSLWQRVKGQFRPVSARAVLESL